MIALEGTNMGRESENERRNGYLGMGIGVEIAMGAGLASRDDEGGNG